jgi:hypothetical protein
LKPVAKIRYIFRNITLLNVLLITLIVFMGLYTFLPLLNMRVKYVLPSEKKPLTVEKAVEPENAHPSIYDYAIVPEENLFHPERKIPPEKEAGPAPLPKPDVLLYGTLITGDTAVALVEDMKSPVKTPGRGQRQIRMKEGDIMSGFVLKDIEPDKIVMVRGEEQLVVPVMNSQKGKAKIASSAQVAKPRSTATTALSLPEKTLPKTMVPMTPAEDRVRAFFTK